MTYSDEVEEMFKQGDSLIKKGLLKEALSVAKKIYSMNQNSAKACGYIGIIYFVHMNKPRLSVKYFREAVLISPKKETASLFLFNSLWISGYRRQAIEEARRFVRENPDKLKENVSPDYYEIMLKLKIL